MKGEESDGVLLLYDSGHASNFDANFCRVAEYYGLPCQKAALNTLELTDALLREKRGSYFTLAGISPSLLNGKEPLLNGDRLTILKAAIAGGLNLLVSVQQAVPDSAALAQLTDGAVLGAGKLSAVQSDWLVESTPTGPSRILSGMRVTCATSTANDLALKLGRAPAANGLLITRANDAGERLPVLAQVNGGAGTIFVDGGEQRNALEWSWLSRMYYDTCHFSEIVPLMLVVREMYGDRVWHSEQLYANLTIDDPTLTDPFYELSYSGLLAHMQAHNFHTTIAFVPANLQKSQPPVVRLFLAHPDRLSIVQHGNNHDGYEFYKYSVSADATPAGQEYRARPLAEQDQDIQQGLARMAQLRSLTDLPFDQIMIFPYGISPSPTLALLKKYNYLATINSATVPLDAVRSSAWDFEMYQANLDYENFASMFRRPAGSGKPYTVNVQPFLMDLFLGKPALFYSHAYAGELFDAGPGAFDDTADRINNLGVPVQWRSLGNIVRRLYLEKSNDDGSLDVKIYTNDAIISTEQHGGATYHITKPEILNVPIKQLTVNNQEFPYRIEQNVLILDVVAPLDGAPFEVVIRYGS